MPPLSIILLGMLLVTSCGYLTYQLTQALRTGAAKAAGTLHLRREKPLMFWIIVSGQLGFALIGYFYLIAGLLRLVK